jgi:ferredoxin
MIAPELFTLGEVDGTSSAVCEVIPPNQQDLAREAAHSCPEQAILIDEGTHFIGEQQTREKLA